MKLHTKTVVVIDNQKTGQSVRVDRLNRNLSLSKVADAMSVTDSYLSLLELGQRNWTAETFEAAKKAIASL